MSGRQSWRHFCIENISSLPFDLVIFRFFSTVIPYHQVGIKTKTCWDKSDGHTMWAGLKSEHLSDIPPPKEFVPISRMNSDNMSGTNERVGHSRINQTFACKYFCSLGLIIRFTYKLLGSFSLSPSLCHENHLFPFHSLNTFDFFAGWPPLMHDRLTNVHFLTYTNPPFITTKKRAIY